VLKIRTTKDFGESTVSKILELVENASSRKSRSEAFISRFAAVYTPAVCISALALAVLPPVVSLVLGAQPQFSQWLYRALTFLVASCPCALVISIPLSFFAGIGGAGREGILVKGSNYLEALSKTGIVVFDKTGTLTEGVFAVTEIRDNTLPEQELLYLAAHAESASSHPISRSLQAAWGSGIDRSRVADIREQRGCGVTAVVDGRAVAAGNTRLMAMLNLEVTPYCGGGTPVYVAVDGSYAGCIVISDRLKPNAVAAVKALAGAGVKQTVMLTGDTAAAAEQAAKELGIGTVYSQLLPGGKVEKTEELLKAKPAHVRLAFVGDGMNDAPVLSRADIGIAMGAMGSDAAIEAADVVLMDDDPMKIVKAIRISRKTLGIVYQNIVFAIAVKVLSLILVALGMAGMWLAIFADVGVMILAVLNAIRALFVKKL
jgi:Cd2+/Zn2+-exporting ATPase